MAKVTIYTSWLCPYCEGAKRLLTQKGVAFEEIDAPNGSAARATAIEKSGGKRTVPQVFVGDLSLGGYDDLRALDAAGKLDALLAA
jgi:glutaredoxin 3